MCLLHLRMWSMIKPLPCTWINWHNSCGCRIVEDERLHAHTHKAAAVRVKNLVFEHHVLHLLVQDVSKGEIKCNLLEGMR